MLACIMHKNSSELGKKHLPSKPEWAHMCKTTEFRWFNLISEKLAISRIESFVSSTSREEVRYLTCQKYSRC